MHTMIPAAFAATLALLAAAPVAAQSAGDMTFGIGLGSVMPKSDNGTLAGLGAEVGNDVQPTITFEYFIRDNLGIEILAATPFKHDVSLDGLGNIGSVKHLPPTVTLQYHFPTGGAFAPFVGAGVTYVTFFDEETPLGDLELDDSWGLSVHAGFDYWLNDRNAIRADVRWMDIDSDAKLNGASIGTAEIDPVVVGVSYIWKF
ncbi:OmpW family protein [Cereibacter sphaeroides]|uniref:OmpW family protein n=1 Tax=Cereibacter sphaeroides TaxID=1063 RepID=A0AAX1UQR4_CERSP|nr:OmpW family outer membrane protein [Cereibacter sphaeroides]AZB56827.1 OmpW family protein [Cereibacter sphaeroides]AZB61087.1 OmpW family protein [Cereibacter sphaeroides]AZB65245.1 OmpW family protein [Cereibacter sphaeroides]AZB67938.1 OmpW family protein [Cereibacter sphaeroides]EGJ20965.1 outer membrane protein [Cereibacter sphaeroides WS8N]